MQTTMIYGQPDDNIYFEGGINGQYSYYNLDKDFPGFLCAISDGTILKIRYDEEGIWRFVVLHRGDKFDRLQQCPTGGDDYSDIVYLKSASGLTAHIGQCIEKVT